MEPWLCIAGGASLIAASFALSRLRPPDWSSDGEMASQAGKSFARRAAFQRTVRRCNNYLLAVTGGLICLTGFFPHGRIWIWLWLGVLFLLMLVVVLAALDALSSMSGYRRAVPEAARRTFGKQPDP